MTRAHSRAGAPPRPGGWRRRPLRRLAGDRRGVSAVEFALVGSILVVLLLNVVDFAMLIWSQMQVDYAAAVAAQAAYNTCSIVTMPAKAHCPTLDSVVTTAAQSTSLGAAVTNAPPAEEYYCTTGNTLALVATFPNQPPADCSAVRGSNPASVPGDYIRVNVAYTFAPLFSGLSLVTQLDLERTGMAMQRLK